METTQYYLNNGESSLVCDIPKEKEVQYFQIENNLSELNTSQKKKLARNNLGITTIITDLQNKINEKSKYFELYDDGDLKDFIDKADVYVYQKIPVQFISYIIEGDEIGLIFKIQNGNNIQYVRYESESAAETDTLDKLNIYTEDTLPDEYKKAFGQYSIATSSKNGLLSSTDKSKLDTLCMRSFDLTEGVIKNLNNSAKSNFYLLDDNVLSALFIMPGMEEDHILVNPQDGVSGLNISLNDAEDVRTEHKLYCKLPNKKVNVKSISIKVAVYKGNNYDYSDIESINLHIFDDDDYNMPVQLLSKGNIIYKEFTFNDISGDINNIPIIRCNDSQGMIEEVYIAVQLSIKASIKNHLEIFSQDFSINRNETINIPIPSLLRDSIIYVDFYNASNKYDEGDDFEFTFTFDNNSYREYYDIKGQPTTKNPETTLFSIQELISREHPYLLGNNSLSIEAIERGGSGKIRIDLKDAE